jgi:hypothetical protein
LKKDLHPVIEKSGQKSENGVYWYGYCLNNPLRYTDPTGYNAVDDFVAGMIANGYNHWNSSTGYSTLNETDLTLYALYSIVYGGGGGIPSGSGFQGPGSPYMLGEVTVAAKTPEKNNQTKDRGTPWYYGIPGVGPALESGNHLNNGNYWAALMKSTVRILSFVFASLTIFSILLFNPLR